MKQSRTKQSFFRWLSMIARKLYFKKIKALKPSFFLRFSIAKNLTKILENSPDLFLYMALSVCAAA
jgi:hypothetical protein